MIPKNCLKQISSLLQLLGHLWIRYVALLKANEANASELFLVTTV